MFSPLKMHSRGSAVFARADILGLCGDLRQENLRFCGFLCNLDECVVLACQIFSFFFSGTLLTLFPCCDIIFLIDYICGIARARPIKEISANFD